jgi:hypothetical protein
MPNRSNGKGQTNCSPWSSRMGVGRGANDATPKRTIATKPPEPMEKNHGGGQDPHSVVEPVKKKRKKRTHYRVHKRKHWTLRSSVMYKGILSKYKTNVRNRRNVIKQLTCKLRWEVFNSALRYHSALYKVTGAIILMESAHCNGVNISTARFVFILNAAI